MGVSRHLGHAPAAHICDAAARGQQLACSAVCMVVHGYEKGRELFFLPSLTDSAFSLLLAFVVARSPGRYCCSSM